MKDRNSLLLILLLAGFISSIYFLALVGTTLTGLVVGTYESQQSLSLNQEFTQTSELDFQFENLSYVRLNGEVFGEGQIEILLQTNSQNYIIYSEQLLENETLTLNQECLETCVLEKDSSQKILIQIDGNLTLNLQNIEYAIVMAQEIEEVDVQTILNQTILIYETLTLDLNQYFNTNEIFYDALSSDGYTYEINNNQITFTPIQTGNFRAKIYGVVNDVVHESNDFYLNIIEEIQQEPEQENTTESEEDNMPKKITLPIEEEPNSNESSDQTQEEQIIEEETNTDSNESTQQPVEEQPVQQEPAPEPQQPVVEQEQPVQEPQPQIQQQQSAASFNTRQSTIQTDELQGVLNQGSAVTIIENYHSQNVPQRNEIIAFNHAREGTVFKIIKGIPGDSFRVENNRIYINNQVVTNSQGVQQVVSDRAQILLRLYQRDYNGIIPTNAYFIVGNLPERDTGSLRYGLVHISDFEGTISTN
jgi:signal peptidase I